MKPLEMHLMDSESQIRMKLMDQLNTMVVMDLARADPEFMDQLISRLESRNLEGLAQKELWLLEWAQSTRRILTSNS